MAEGDDIIVTEPVIDRLDPDIPVHDTGVVDRQGVAHPRHLLAVTWRHETPRHE